MFAPVPKIGDRVQIAPHLDAWMQGDRYGLVVGSAWSLKTPGEVNAWRVKLDRSGRVLRIRPDGIYEILERGD
jgi:hypothetical protein